MNPRMEITLKLMEKVHELLQSSEPNLQELKTYFGLMLDDQSFLLAIRKQEHAERKDAPPQKSYEIHDVQQAICVLFGKEYLN